VEMSKPESAGSDLADVFNLLVQESDRSPQQFAVKSETPHPELAADIPDQRVPHRCRAKLFELDAGRLAVFFYKTSAVPFSRDRFSYGAVQFSASDISSADVSGWLAYLASGFDWDLAPPKLRRAFTFDVPD